MLCALQVKTCYSILSSLNRIDDLTKKAKDMGYSSLAITDTNNMFGVYEFYLACLNSGIKPIIGMEVKSSFDNYILIAKNNNGYKNLIKIATIISDHDISYDELNMYSKDIILIMPIFSYKKNIIELFDEYFIGYSNTKDREAIGEKGVLITDICYLEKEDYKYIDYLTMIRDDKKLGEIELNTFAGKHLLDRDEYTSLISSNIFINKNMEYIVNNCNVTFDKREGLLPIYDENINSFDYLCSLCNKGLKRRLANVVSDIYQKRLNYELDVINKMGFCDYFLVVWDYVKYAKFNNILVGPGRGSAAGSLVSYCLGITDVDPIKYDLLFERFLNPERVTMPDIDIDFDSEKRSLVTDYVMNKYGEKKAIGIITFNTLGAKQVIRDVGRVLDISLPIIDEIAKSIIGKNLQESYAMNGKFYRLINSNSEYMKLYKASVKLEGLPRHISVHAAGIVMSNISIDEVIPLYKSPLGMYISAFSKDYLEPLGLLKMDFLGLDNLTLISNVIEEIREKEKINISFEKIPLDDKKTLKVFRDVDTDGIFQFESVGMKRFLSKLKVNSFDDIATALALYRPGPMDNIDLFIARREGREKIDYIHPDLEDILKPTYGIIIYQEQIMQIVRKMANYSYGEADILRRAMSKKKESIILNEKPKFIEGSLKNGYDEKTATEVYDLILKFANYGFNKSHSISYAITAYKMAFIKTYFLKYFIAGVLTNSIGNINKINTYINRARKSSIKILPPDVNESNIGFTATEEGIRCPLSIISGVGTSISNDILKERENGRYLSPTDFITRTYNKGIGKKTLSSLIYAGAISFGYNKRTLIENLDTILNYADIAKDGGIIENLEPEISTYEEYSKGQLVSLELKTIGFYLTNHPASKYRDDNIVVNTANISDFFNNKVVMVIMINRIKETTTKNNDVMAFIVGSDEFGEADFTCFPDVYKRFNFIKVGNVVKIFGRVEKRYDKYQVIINNINVLEANDE